jgi:hypothetical protein
MKKARKNERMTVKCAERDRLWAAFLKVGREWGSMQDRMRRMLRQKSVFEPDLAQIDDVKNRLETTHRLFSKHIVKHGCWQPKISVLKAKKKTRKSRK